ncbi:hypothetical protein [Bythopirellula goksoeyrii]|uniref:Uncharacterized protein n=1 Tax=Bythopirellula goksoeyrii TaxID=1400387 RepID=A0A5B9QCB8_9BACT|nr:hypothetical protein [Bythopirellula goksoeyrii]QEG35260.1 hypothetical protein Pr1d_25550 [Bythopirellula goksoeyrii]
MSERIKAMMNKSILTSEDVAHLCKHAGLGGPLPLQDAPDGWKKDTIQRWAENTATRNRVAIPMSEF